MQEPCSFCGIKTTFPCETACEYRECMSVAKWDHDDLKDESGAWQNGATVRTHYPKYEDMCYDLPPGYLPDGTPSDTVDRPAHYTRWKMQPIDFIAINDRPWWMAKVIQYIMRYDAKDGLKDLYKARSYLDTKIREMEGHNRFLEKPAAGGAEMRFAGRVIDGPWRGKMIEKPGPYFRGAIYPSIWRVNPDCYAQTITFPQVEYRWVDSLGEWAMVY
jgi:hypothetical protein